MSSIDPYYDDDDRTVPRLGSIQFPGANEDTDCEEDGEETEIEEKSDEETEIEEESEEEEEEAKDLWKTNPLGSGLNETQKTVVDWDSEMEDARKAEENVKKTAEAVKQRVVIDLTGEETEEEDDEEDEERGAEQASLKRPREKGTELSQPKLKRTNTTLSAVSA